MTDFHPSMRFGTAATLMAAFAEDTGLLGDDTSPRRYLWTDAFAVCNFFALARETGQQRYADLALKLIDQVHETLGKHHPDSEQTGWLSGLEDAEARQHPTIAGLRIGKKLNERAPHEPYDEASEWDRDGQYFHYLTKWMHALCVASDESGEQHYLRWAIELASTAFDAFSYSVTPEAPRRMYWKMSIDLSRPQVASMGQHDPLDGLITFLELKQQAERFKMEEGAQLEPAISELERICKGQQWATADSLGIGGLLADTWRLQQLQVSGTSTKALTVLCLLDDSIASVQAFLQNNTLHYPAHYRLAFRELGMGIGLQAVSEMMQWIESQSAVGDRDDILPRLKALLPLVPLHQQIEQFWLDEAHQQAETWQEHIDINRVMLATSLIPERFLMIHLPSRSLQ